MTEQQTVSRETVAEAVLSTQMAIIDAAVRASREQGWCGEFENAMRVIFPDGPPDGGREFTDSDGVSCRGYDRDGFRNGYDRDGFDRDGFTGAGYNREGRDRDGRDRYGRDRDGIDRDGYDAAGFNRDGVSRDSEEYRARFRYNSRGYDRDGFDRHGRDPFGRTREQCAADTYEYESTSEGHLWDIAGVGPDGYDRSGRHVRRHR